MRGRRACGGGVREERRPFAQELVPDVQHDLLRVERLAGRERGAVVGAAPALGAGVGVEELLPGEVAKRGRAEAVLVLDVGDEVERAAWCLLAEEHVRKRRGDMEVLRLREIRREREHRDDVEPPGVDEDHRRALVGVNRAQDRASDRRRRVSLLEIPGGQSRPFEHEQRDHEDPDQGEDHVSVERDVHPRWPQEGPAHGRDRDRGQDQDGEDVDRPREEGAARAGDVEAEDPAQQEVDRPDGDDEEAPEDEGVRQSADVVRALEQLALSEVDDELVAEAPPGVIDPRLVAAESHVPVEPPGAPEEGAESDQRKSEQDRAPWHEAACRGDHSFRSSSAMTSFMISLVPS